MHLKYNIVNENYNQDVCQSMPRGEVHAFLSGGDIVCNLILQSRLERLSALQAALLRLHVSAKGGVNDALVTPALCFEEIHDIRVKPNRDILLFSSIIHGQMLADNCQK
jgi:hypothetical protein